MNTISKLKNTKGNNSANLQMMYWLLFPAYHLMLFHICSKIMKIFWTVQSFSTDTIFILNIPRENNSETLPRLPHTPRWRTGTSPQHAPHRHVSFSGYLFVGLITARSLSDTSRYGYVYVSLIRKNSFSGAVQSFSNGLYFRVRCICDVPAWLSDKIERSC